MRPRPLGESSAGESTLAGTQASAPLPVTTVSAVGEAFDEWAIVGHAVRQRGVLVVRRNGSAAAMRHLLAPAFA